MNEARRTRLEHLSLALTAALLLAFVAYCLDLTRVVDRERAEVSLRAGWLREAQELIERPDPARLGALRGSVGEHPGTASLLDPLDRGDVHGFTIAARRELGSLSADLGGRWDALNRIALVALVLAVLVTALLWRSQHRRRVGEQLRGELTATNAKLKQMHATAEEASAMKSAILAYVSHEFRTPLQAIVGISGSLAVPTLADDQRRAHAANLRTASEGLLRLVDGILDLSRIEHGQLSLRAAPFDPKELFSGVVALLAPQAAEKRLRLDCELAADLPRWLYGDGQRVRQVTLNLLGNAIKFTRAGVVRLRVTAEARTMTSRLRIEVRDTGPGIPASAMPGLFKPFARVYAPGQARVSGSGLGLSISKNIIEMLGGTIEVASKVGSGSTFTCVLELAVADLPEPEAPTASAARRYEPADGREVLIADDDPINRSVIERMVEHAGFTTVTVGDGQAAVQRAREGDFAAVLLDVDMPGMSGPEAARRIREQGGDMPILAVTGHAGLSEQLRCHESGIDAVLVKPLDIEALQEALMHEIDARSCGIDMSGVRSVILGIGDGVGLFDVFLQEMDKDLAALDEAVRRGDREGVRQSAHRLGGSAMAFGAELLASACKALEALARGEGALAAAHVEVVKASASTRGAFEREGTRLRRHLARGA